MTVQTLVSQNMQVTIRPLSADDAPRLQSMHLHLSADTIVKRFNNCKPELPDAEAAKLAGVDHRLREAVGAFVGDDMIGVARYDKASFLATEAEFAIVIRDDWQRRFVGSRLLRVLARLARTRGITTLVIQRQNDNRGPLDLLKRNGFILQNRKMQGADCTETWHLPARS